MNSLEQSVGFCVIQKMNNTIADHVYVSVINHVSQPVNNFVERRINEFSLAPINYAVAELCLNCH